MNDMVERVALAISGSDDPANILDIHRGRARAAIAVMRDPTRQMVRAGGVMTENDGEAEAAWDAMIDAALK